MCSIRPTFVKRVSRCEIKAMAVTIDRKESLVVRLHELEVVKFGEFKLKSGILSPIYIDLRRVVSFPDVLEEVSDVLWESSKKANFDYLCGVPYTALPFSTVMSIQHKVPLLMRRKEVKDYGTRKAIEGVFQKQQKVLVVEDLVTSGSSVLETVEALNTEGLIVQDAVVLLDRQQGAKETLQTKGIHLHSAFTVSFLLEVLLKKNLVTPEVVSNVQGFLKGNQMTEKKLRRRLGYAERRQYARCPMSQRCFEIMERKKTNLAVAADLTSTQELLKLVEILGPHICVVKTHVDILDRWDESVQNQLMNLAKIHDFLIFEDRKFADIGNTVVEQYSRGLYRISDWSDITNAHLIPGPGIIDGLSSVGISESKGLLLLAEMSSEGNLATGDYTQSVMKEAMKHPEFVMGFISINPAQWSVPQAQDYLGLIHMTPGVALSTKGDDLGQQYNTPSSVIQTRGSDVIIVGRGIIKAKDPLTAALEYKQAGWEAYQKSINQTF